MADWLDCIRNGGEPRCNIEEGFEEAVACHMATESYLQGRRVEWDPVKADCLNTTFKEGSLIWVI